MWLYGDNKLTMHFVYRDSASKFKKCFASFILPNDEWAHVAYKFNPSGTLQAFFNMYNDTKTKIASPQNYIPTDMGFENRSTFWSGTLTGGPDADKYRPRVGLANQRIWYKGLSERQIQSVYEKDTKGKHIMFSLINRCKIF